MSRAHGTQQADLKVINGVLDELIEKAQNTRMEADLEDLEKRNYDKVRSSVYILSLLAPVFLGSGWNSHQTNSHPQCDLTGGRRLAPALPGGPARGGHEQQAAPRRPHDHAGGRPRDHGRRPDVGALRDRAEPRHPGQAPEGCVRTCVWTLVHACSLAPTARIHTSLTHPLCLPTPNPQRWTR